MSINYTIVINMLVDVVLTNTVYLVCLKLYPNNLLLSLMGLKFLLL